MESSSEEGVEGTVQRLRLKDFISRISRYWAALSDHKLDFSCSVSFLHFSPGKLKILKN